MDALSQFTQATGADQLSQTEKAMAGASAEGKGQNIQIPGTYRMRVKAFVDKKGKAWPRFELSEKPKTKGDLVLHAVLECVDGTDVVAKGDTAFISITVAKAKGATDEKIANTASFCKPVLAALTGNKSIVFTDAFLREYFTIDSDVEGKITRQHKMTKDVMVVLGYGKPDATGKVWFGHQNIRSAVEGDKSQSVKSGAAVTDGALAEINGSKGELKSSVMDMSFDGDIPANLDQVEDS